MKFVSKKKIGIALGLLLVAVYVAAQLAQNTPAYRAIRLVHSRLDRSYAKRHAQVGKAVKTARLPLSEHDRELGRLCLKDSPWIMKPLIDSWHTEHRKATRSNVSKKDLALAAAFRKHQFKD
jgi:hypothetical protein